MIRCSFCGNENLRIEGESKLIDGARYGICNCGKVMIIQGDIAIPTPTNNDEMTKALIQDAADALNIPSALRAVSLNREDIQVNMQPTQVKENIARYIADFVASQQEEEDELELDMEDDYCYDCGYYDCTCDEEDDFDYEEEESACGCGHCSCGDSDKSIKDYLLVTPSGDKHIYRNADANLIEAMINDIGSHFSLYELKEVKLKKEEVKVVRYKL